MRSPWSSRDHSEAEATQAEAAFDRVFKERDLPEDIPEIAVDLNDPVHLPALLSELDLVSSNGEGRRMIDQGAVKIDGTQVAAGDYDVPLAAVSDQVVQVGKRRYARPTSRR